MAAQVIDIVARQDTASEAHKMLIRKLTLSLHKLADIREVFLRDEVRSRMFSGKCPGFDPDVYIPASVDAAYEDVNRVFDNMVSFVNGEQS